MNVFEKILERLKKTKELYVKLQIGTNSKSKRTAYYGKEQAIDIATSIVNEAEKEYNNGWIPCSERMPEVETELLILAKRKFRDGDFRYIITTAMYEDGTVSECDSCWYWYDIEGEWDEENDCYIVPEGWWENKHYNPDECYNNEVDDEVIAWQPLPEPYKESEKE